MKVGSLFSGIGGFDLGLEWAGFEIAWQVENDSFCLKVLEKHWPDVKRYGDIKDVSGWELAENDGICYNKVCEASDKNRQAFRTLSERMKSKKIEELIASAKIAGKKCPCLQAWLTEVTAGGFAPESVAISICEEKTLQMQMEGLGCEEKETLIGKEEKGTSVGSAIKKQKSQNGEEEYLQEIPTPVKFAEENQKKIINCEHTILNSGVPIQKADLNFLMEKLYASGATTNCMRRKENPGGKIDVLTAGVPCQPASVAGKRRGTKDDRWLWGETFRIIREVEPTWIILENVRGLLTLENGMVFENLLLELESYGYETRTFIIPACAVNAPHRRDRVWIIGYADKNSKSGLPLYARKDRVAFVENSLLNGNRIGEHDKQRNRRDIWDAGAGDAERVYNESLSENTNGIRGRGRSENGRQVLERQSSEAETAGSDCEGGAVANASTSGLQGIQEGEFRKQLFYVERRSWQKPWYEAATRLCGMDDGLSSELDIPRDNRNSRLKALGNAVVPQIVEIIGRAIMEIEKCLKL